MKLHQQGHIHSLYGQMFPVVLKLEATDDGHLSGFVNFHGGKRPEGFPVGQKFSIITNHPEADARELIREWKEYREKQQQQ